VNNETFTTIMVCSDCYINLKVLTINNLLVLSVCEIQVVKI
jgi:hypothetical protein